MSTKIITYKFILLIFCTGFSCVTNGQTKSNFSISGLGSVNIGLHYLDSYQEGSSIPKIGSSFGIQSIKSLSGKISIGLELQIIRTSSEINNYRSTYGYYSLNYSTIIHETVGELYIDETDFQLPLFLRHYLGKRKKYYFEYGVIYKRLIHSNSKSDLDKIEYFSSFITPDISEVNRLEVPDISTVSYWGFDNDRNKNRFGLIAGFGREFLIKDNFSVTSGIRFSNNASGTFKKVRSPKFRYLELNIQIPLI